MAEVVLDANVLVALLDSRDVHAARAAALVDRLAADGHDAVIVDFLLTEAISVLCRRARERKVDPPQLDPAIERVREWYDAGAVRFLATEMERVFPRALAVIAETHGVLNFNDSLLVVLQREGVIDDVASFDTGLDAADRFRRLA